MSDTSLKKLAAKLAAVGGKKQLDSKDLDLLREIKDGITAVLQGLKECDVCGAAVAEIMRLEIDGVRAAVCQPCGIKSLKNKAIVIRAAKKREMAREKPHHAPASHAPAAHKSAEKHHDKPAARHQPFKTESSKASAAPAARSAAPAASLPQTSLFGDSVEKSAPAGDSAYEEIARETGAKIMLLKKIQQLAAAVAFPMSMDRTVSYVRMEAQGQGLNLQAEEIRKILTALSRRGLAKIKE